MVVARGKKEVNKLFKLNLLVLFVLTFILISSTVVLADSVTCNSCSSCATAAGTANRVINLTGDISTMAGSCIGSVADNVVIDCKGFTIGGNDSGSNGIQETTVNNITIQNCIISNFTVYGITFSSGSNANILGNTFRYSTNGIRISNIQNSTIDNNLFEYNYRGITDGGSSSSSYNNITSNSFMNNSFLAISVSYGASISNLIWNNNFIDNNPGDDQVSINSDTNQFNLSTQGNFWSTYDGPYAGCYDDNSDFICDSDYTAEEGAIDYHPRVALAGNCVTPHDGLLLNYSTILCSGNYSLTDSDGSWGIINFSKNNISLYCNNTNLRGDHTGFGMKLNTDYNGVFGCNFINYSRAISGSGSYYYFDKIYGNNFPAAYVVLYLSKDNNTVKNSVFETNQSTAIQVGSSSENNYFENITVSSYSFSDTAIEILGDYNNITQSAILDSNKGISITGNNNLIWANNFLNNSDAMSNAGGLTNQFNLSTQGNYYSDYDSEMENCFDSDLNLICDSTYVIGTGLDYYPSNYYIGECITPLDQMELNYSVVICNGSYNYGGSGNSGVLIFGQDNMSIFCNQTEFNGTGGGAGTTGIKAAGKTGIQVSNCSFYNYTNAIYFDNVNSSLIKNSFINHTTTAGIFIEDSYSNMIQNNTIYNSSSKGIYLLSSDYINVTDNFIDDANTGIDFYNSMYSRGILNTVLNSQSGIRLYQSNESQLYDNNISLSSSIGINVYKTHSSRVFSNEIYSGSSDGINLYQSNFTNVSLNNLYLNVYGLDIYLSFFNNITNNIINNNSYGLYFTGTDSENNLVYNNNFSNSSISHVYNLNSNNHFNTSVAGVAQGNYWDDIFLNSLEIYDLNGDGYGDFGSQYPYNLSNGGNVSVNVTDFGPILSQDSDGDGSSDNVDCAPSDPDVLTPYNNLIINRSVTLCNGTYYISDSGSNGVLIFEGGINNTNLDCNGSVLIGSQAGYGIFQGTAGSQNHTIQNCELRNYSTAHYLTYNIEDDYIFNNTYIENIVGIRLVGTDYTNIVNNLFINNNQAIKSTATSILKTNITNNTFINNQRSLNLTHSAGSSSLLIYRNNFLNSSLERMFDTSFKPYFEAEQQGNYWSDYDSIIEGCIDNDNDLVCDDNYDGIINGGVQDIYPHNYYIGDCVTPYNGMELNYSQVLCNGTYEIAGTAFAGVISLNQNNMSIYCNATELKGSDTADTYGMWVEGFGVDIRYCNLSNYYTGVALGATADYSNIINASISNGTFGFYTGAINSSLSGLNFFAEEKAVVGDGAHNLSITSSSILHSISDGVTLTNSDYVFIQNTTLTNATNGIFLSSSDNATISYNLIEGGQSALTFLNSDSSFTWLNHFYGSDYAVNESGTSENNDFCIDEEGNFYNSIFNSTLGLNRTKDCGPANISIPNGGEKRQDFVYINWTAQSSLFDINYSIFWSNNSGTTWNLSAYTLDLEYTLNTSNETIFPDGSEYMVRVIPLDMSQDINGTFETSDATFTIDRTVPTTTDNTTTDSRFWYIDTNASIQFNATDNDGVNYTFVCNYSIYDAACTPSTGNRFNNSVPDSNLSFVSNYTCGYDSTCQFKLRYYSVDAVANEENAKTSYQVNIVFDNYIQNTSWWNSNITGSSTVNNSVVTNSHVDNCYVENSTIINSTVKYDSDYNYPCRIINSTIINSNIISSHVYNSYIDPTTIIDSVVEDSTIIDSYIEYSNVRDSTFCDGFNLYAGVVESSVLSSGSIVYGGSTYYSPFSLANICGGEAPVPVGDLTTDKSIVKNGDEITFSYSGGMGYTVTLNASPLREYTYTLTDFDNDGIYTRTILVQNLGNFEHTFKALVNDSVGNLFNSSAVTVTVDNINPTGSISIEGPAGSSLTGSQTVTLSVSYSDENDIGQCRFVNENISGFDNTVGLTHTQINNSLLDPFGLSVVDLDLDGDIDLVSSARTPDSLHWWENNGAGSFTANEIANGHSDFTDTEVGDMDGDGDLDIVVVTYDTDSLSWWQNDGTQSFTQTVIDASFGASFDVDIVDLDSDGDNDLVVSSNENDQVVWYENSGTASFTQHSINNSFAAPRDLEPIDLDSDGDIDVIGTSETLNLTVWWENNGTQNFTQHTINEGLIPRAIELADLDSDGDIDLAGISFTNNTVSVWENLGNQTFSYSALNTSLNGSTDLKIYDFDSDNDLDILASSYGLNKLVWFKNQGSSSLSFTQNIIQDGFTSSRLIEAANIDNDNYLDIVGYNDNGNLSWWQNNLNIGSEWRTCSPTVPWVLSPSYGNKTVMYQIKDSVGNIVNYNETIEYRLIQDYTPPGTLIVYDGLSSGTNDINWTNSATSLSAHWTEAIDDISTVYYKYKIMVNGSINLTNYTSVGTNTSVTVTGLSLVEGTNYSFDVMAYNPYNITGTNAQSDGATVDLTNPLAPGLNSTTHIIQNTTYANADPVFNFTATDPTSGGVSSGVLGYSYVLDSYPGTGPDDTIESRYSEELQKFNTNGNSKLLKENGNGEKYQFYSQIKSNLTSDQELNVRLALFENDFDTRDNMSVTVYAVMFDSGDTPDAFGDTDASIISNQVQLNRDFAYAQNGESATIYAADLTLNTSVNHTSKNIYLMITSVTADSDNANNLSIATTTKPSDINYGTDLIYCNATSDCTNVTSDYELAIEVKKVDAGNMWEVGYENLADGTYYFHVKAKDEAGNFGNTSHYTIIVDTIGAGVEITSPYTGQSFTSDTIDVGVSVDEAANVSIVSVMYFQSFLLHLLL